MIRKIFFIVLLIFTFSSFAFSDVTIAVPKWFSPQSASNSIKVIYDEFNREYPDKVNVQVINGKMEDYVNQILLMIHSESAVDLVIVPINLVKYISETKSLIDFSSYIPERKLVDFLPALRKSCSVKRALYGLPYDTDVMVIFYNKDILKNKGFKDGVNIKDWNWKTFIQLAKSVTIDKDKDGKIDIWGFAYPAGRYIRFINYFEPWLINAGCFDDPDPIFLLNSRSCFRNVLKLYKRLIDEEISPPEVVNYMGYDMYKGLIESRFSMAISGSWIFERLNNSGSFGVLPVPPMIGGRKNYTISSGWAIIGIKKSRINPMAIKLAEKLTSKRSMILKWREKRYLPVLKSVLKSKEIMCKWPYSFFADQLLNHSTVLVVNPMVNQRAREIMNLTHEVLTGQTSIEEAVKRFK